MSQEISRHIKTPHWYYQYQQGKAQLGPYKPQVHDTTVPGRKEEGNMDYYGQFLREKREGKYAGCRYPNLVEIHGGMPTDYFAEVTPELMLAVFRGEEDLTLMELSRIARYNGIPLSVLTCPKLIMLDMGRRRHRRMVAEVDSLYIKLKCMAREGNQKAEKYLEWASWEQQRFMGAAHNNRLSYGHYLVAKEEMQNYILFAAPKQEKRGIEARKGGAE